MAFKKSSHPPIICDFCQEPGHGTHACIKCGPKFWPPWHAQKVEQNNLKHGDKPPALSPPAPVPPPPKACFAPGLTEPSVRAIQAAVEEHYRSLEEQLDEGKEGEMLMVRAMTTRHQQADAGTSTTHLATIHEQFDAQSDDGSLRPLGNDSSSDLDFDELKLYDQPVNC